MWIGGTEIKMAKEDKEYSLRMQGMIYAYNIAKKQGIEMLEKEMRMRNVMQAPMKFTGTQIKEFWDSLSQNLYNTVLTTAALVLHEKYGFGKKRLQDFKRHYDKAVNDALDLDYIGVHYVTLTDYAIYLKQELGIEINTEIVAACQNSYDESNPNYRMANIDRVIKELEQHGFKDAAVFLGKKVY